MVAWWEELRPGGLPWFMVINEWLLIMNHPESLQGTKSNCPPFLSHTKRSELRVNVSQTGDSVSVTNKERVDVLKYEKLKRTESPL